MQALDLLRVLVIDDNKDQAESLRTLMEIWGYEVQAAYGGTAALTLAQEFHPQVILVDLAMPGLNGYDFARRLHKLPGMEGTLLLAVTGYTDAAHLKPISEAGFVDYLIKPVDPSVLQQLLSLVDLGDVARTMQQLKEAIRYYRLQRNHARSGASSDSCLEAVPHAAAG